MTKMETSGFAIYYYTHAQTQGFNLDTYQYDSTWKNFLNSAELSTVKLSDDNIIWYDWANQQVMLNADGEKIFSDFVGSVKDSPREYRYWEQCFIVTLNGKRLYAGRIEIRYSAMAIRYPVMSYGADGTNNIDKFSEKPLLWLFPCLLIPPKGDPNEDGKLTVRNPEIHDYFEKINKLKP